VDWHLELRLGIGVEARGLELRTMDGIRNWGFGVVIGNGIGD